MKQNTAYGASLMTRPIRVIETSNRPSMPRRRSSMPGVVLLTTMPTPHISAKDRRARYEASIATATTNLHVHIGRSTSRQPDWHWLSVTLAGRRWARDDQTVRH